MNNGVLFELLAELFQKLVADENIKVSRRHIFRRSANDIAEVDILVSGNFGTSKMMVAIECRDRAQPQGKEWIQQIIGKRDDLRSFGIRHWIALSGSGFTEPAKKLAERAGIELLVPCEVSPTTPENPGPHNLLNFSLIYNKWTFGEVRAEIGHDEESIRDKVKDLLLSEGTERMLIECEGTKRSVNEHLAKLAEEEIKRLENGGTDWTKTTCTLKLEQYAAEVGGIPFTLAYLEVDVMLIKEDVKAEFRMLTFSDPYLSNFFGVIGVNSFNSTPDPMHLLAGFKPGYPAKLVWCARKKSGDPIPGFVFRFNESQINNAGFQLNPPTKK